MPDRAPPIAVLGDSLSFTYMGRSLIGTVTIVHDNEYASMYAYSITSQNERYYIFEKDIQEQSS